MTEEKKPSDYTTPVFHTSGGGLAEPNFEGSDRYRFVESPHPSLGLEIGDLVPIELGLSPANEPARRLCDQPDGFH